MHSDDTAQPETAEQAIGVLLDWQQSEGCVPEQPASGDTIESEAGWAFFNVRGYLGTVTWKGEVVMEEQFADEE